MSLASVLYRFRLDVSDIDRGVYEKLDFRLAMHASESFPYLLTRMLAYALNVEPGLEFSPEGLDNPDIPPMSSDDPKGGKDLWIEIGNPSSRRLHKAAKAARRVKVYTYKNPEALLGEVRGVYEADRIELFSFSEEFLTRLEHLLERDNQWGIIRDGASLIVSSGEDSESGELSSHYLK